MHDFLAKMMLASTRPFVPKRWHRYLDRARVKPKQLGKVGESLADASPSPRSILRHQWQPTTRTLVEHAGATSLAGAETIRHQIQGKRVVLIPSGANITINQLKTVIDD